MLKLTGIRDTVFKDRYSLKDEKGNPREKSPQDMWKRVAKGIAEIENPQVRKYWQKKFYEVMEDFKFVPGGRILSGAGTGYKVTFYNCFVLPSPQDSRDGILETLKQMVEIMARGGGVGINLSSLRPRGTRVRKVNGFSSGPCNWAELFSVATKDIIQQGGCFAGSTRIMTHRGLTPIKEIAESRNNYFAQTHEGYRKITTLFDNGIKKLYEVKTRAGFRVSVTAEHKFVTVDKSGRFYLKKLADLKIDETLVFLLGDWLDDLPFVSLQTKLVKPSKYSFGLKQVRLPNILNEDLAFLLGVYDADGSKIKDEYSKNGKGLRIAVAQNRPQDLQRIVAAVQRVFSINPIIKKGDGAVLNVQIYSRKINEFLKLNSLLKDYSVTVKVPDLIYQSPKRVVEAYIAGVFVGDGTNRGGKGGMRISTVSKEFAQSLQLILLNLGVAAQLKIQNRKEKNWKPLMIITINGHKFMKRFYEIVSPYCEKANDHNFSVRDGAFNWPFNLTERFAYLSGIQRTIARTNPTTSHKTTQFLTQKMSLLRDEDKDDLGFLASCVPDRISSIDFIGEENVYDLEVNTIHLLSGNGFYTSNSRRGALMLMLWDWHPDIEEFITVKRDLSRINGANLSVCVSDKFMEAVKKDADWNLVFPETTDKEYDAKWNGYLDDWVNSGKKVKVVKTVKARKIWDLICEAAWASAEPGLVFMERYNKWNNNWYFNKINCVNPCVTGDTLVATSNGIKSMRNLYKEGKPFLAVVNGNHYLSTHVKLTGIKPVYKLKTREGYELRLTQDHKVATISGLKEAGKLIKGDKILLSTGGSFSTQGTLREGQVLGWLVGDGAMKKDVATLYFYKNEKKELAQYFAVAVNQMVTTEGVTARTYPIAPQFVSSEDKAVIESVRLWRIAGRFGLSASNKYVVPEKIFAGSQDFQRGFLQGLFSSDGCVIGSPAKGVSVRLTSVSLSLLKDVQKLLLNFGIVSKIYQIRRIAQDRLMPDGKGNEKLYHCQAYHELVISKESLIRFAALINFLQEEKKDKLSSLLALYSRGPYKETFTATFESLEKEGLEEVFDITVADIHKFSANGLIIANCGEEGLPAFGVCNLCSINLTALVKDGKINYQSLSEIAKVGVRFQDDVIDADSYVFPQIRETQQNGERRIGLGTMGLGDALIKMKLRYGSPESLKVIDKIYRTIRNSAYGASAEIAKEKGAFPKFDAPKYLQGHFIKQLPNNIKEKIKKWGIRNSVLLQQAPTGSTSLLAGVSSGIEPVYEFSFIRRDRLGEHKLYHPLFEAWKKTHPKDPVPAYFVSANDLTPEDHVKVQSSIQKYVDASISKTVNAPNSHTVADVQKLYLQAYESGCKGVTYMREGSRPGVLERISPEKTEKEEKLLTLKGNGLKISEIKPRPAMVHGATYQIDTPVGTAFVTINMNGGREPLEMFINVGKAGSDVTAMAEALGRLASLVLRMQSTVPPLERAKQIFNQLIGIGGSKSLGFGDKRVRSLPDAIAKILAMHLGFKIKSGNGTQTQTPTTDTVTVMTQQPLLEDVKSEYDLCPSCGVAALAYEEGCKKCYSCGYSEC